MWGGHAQGVKGKLAAQLFQPDLETSVKGAISESGCWAPPGFAAHSRGQNSENQSGCFLQLPWSPRTMRFKEEGPFIGDTENPSQEMCPTTLLLLTPCPTFGRLYLSF